MTDLPNGWTMASPREWARSTANALAIGPFGSNLKVDDYRDSGVPLVFVREIRSEYFGGEKTKYVSTDKAEELRAHRVVGDDLLVTKMGDPPGDTAVYPPDRPSGIITADCIKISVDPAVSSPSFLKFWLRAPQARREVLAETRGVAQQKLSLKRFSEIQLPMPPFEEQRRIVAEVDSLTARSRRAREALDKIPPLLERLRQSVLAAAFRGDLTTEWRRQHPDVEPASDLLERLHTERRRRWEEAELAAMSAKGKVPANDKWKENYEEPARLDASGLPALPEGWAWARLEALTDPVRTIRYGIVLPGPEFPGGVRYVKVKHMKGNVIDTTDLPRTDPNIHAKYARAALGKGDLLVSIRGTFGGVALVPDELEGANITQDSARIAPLPGVRPEFLSAMLRSPFGQAYFERVAKGVAVQGVNIQDLRPMPIPLAPEAEQAAIAQAAEQAEAMMLRTETATASAEVRLGTLDQSILAKAFRGELVPQDPNDEPASVLIERIRAERKNGTTPATSAPEKRRGRRTVREAR